jgi:hypothetical protein
MWESSASLIFRLEAKLEPQKRDYPVKTRLDGNLVEAWARQGSTLKAKSWMKKWPRSTSKPYSLTISVKLLISEKGRHSTEVAFTLLTQPTRVRFSAKVFTRKIFIFDVAMRFVNSQLCLA